jgi:hypothetical protein
MEAGLISIYSGAILSLAMAVFHTRFYRLFKWGEDFKRVSLLNRRVLYTVHVALLLLFFLFGLVSLIYARELSRSKGLALGINLSYSGFWLWRALWQVSYFKAAAGKRPSPASLLMILWFLLLFVAYLTPVVVRMVK